MRKAKAKSKETDYLHGFTREEQDRLVRQARFFEQSIYENVDFSKQGHVLEVGCGVGAQTEILLERFPQVKITGLDASAAQLKRARQRLAPAVKQGRLKLQQADALNLPFADNSFDGAFDCWFLEHVAEPVNVLREIRRVLKASAVIYCTEVLNATFYVHPYSPATLQYWFAFNDFQWSIKGDPFVGGKLANYLMEAGFQNVSTDVKVYFYDNRKPKHRAEIIQEWTQLLLSGAPALIKAGRVTREDVEKMKGELNLLRDDPDAVFFWACVQARAQAF